MRVDEAIVNGVFGGSGGLTVEHSTDRGTATFVRRVYPLVNIFATFLAWGASHA
jgi:hypothetical protein